MTLRDLFIDTLRTLWAHKLRTGLTMFGIAWDVIAITLLVAASEGLREGQRKNSETFGKNIMIIKAGRTSLQAGGTRAGRTLMWDAEDYLYIPQSSPDCDCIVPEQGNTVPVRSPYNSASLLVTGSHPPFASIRSIPVGEGRFYSWEDDAVARRVAFLGTEAKQQLFGNRPAVGATIHIGTFPYTVIGVMQRKKQNSSYDGFDVNKIFVPFQTVLRDFPNKPPYSRRSVDRLLVTPKSLEQHEACRAQAVRALARRHRFDPLDEEAAAIWDTVKNAENVRKIFDGMEYFMTAVGITTLFLGGIGVMNVMLVAVRERTHEIGPRLAGGLIGVILSYALSAASGPISFVGEAYEDTTGRGDIRLVITPLSLAVSAAALVLTGLASGLFPAIRAARLDPAEALRYE